MIDQIEFRLHNKHLDGCSWAFLILFTQFLVFGHVGKIIANRIVVTCYASLIEFAHYAFIG